MANSNLFTVATLNKTCHNRGFCAVAFKTVIFTINNSDDMKTEFSVAGIELTLKRFPDNHPNLQGWDAADEHLIKHLKEQEIIPTSLAIINDSFGALSCALTQEPQFARVQKWHETDAYTSTIGCKQNLSLNVLEEQNIEFITSTEPYSKIPAQVLMKLSKNLNYLAYQLRRLSQVLKPGTPLLLAAKAKSIHPALLSLIETNFGNAVASLCWKKTRIITAHFDGKVRSLPKLACWNALTPALKISNYANVFAAKKLDIGTRLMLDNLPEGEYDSVVDLGCGNGILGLRAAQVYPRARVHFVDDSHMALASAQLNWQQNSFAMQQGQFHWDNCLSNLPQEVQPGLILCNPPFHQGEAISDHIAWQMFVDSRRRLKKGGLLQVVANRHLGYHVKLKRLFNHCDTLASDRKFVILQARKAD